VCSQLGWFDEAIRHAEAAVRIAEAAGHPYRLYTGSFGLGLAHLRHGDLPRATRVLERGLDLCRTWQIALGTPLLAAALSAAYALTGRFDEVRPLLAHSHLGLGKLYRRTGKPEQAQEHLITATTMYREMDMRFWLEQAEAAMNELTGGQRLLQRPPSSKAAVE
jgi:tetratricopeptide (TPR) repeat protein